MLGYCSPGVIVTICVVIVQNKFDIFSSPEHVVLRLSYYDLSLFSICLSLHVFVCLWAVTLKFSPLKQANRFQWNFT